MTLEALDASGGMVQEVMTMAAERPDAVQLERNGLAREDGPPSGADVALNHLVRQWMKTSQALEQRERPKLVAGTALPALPRRRIATQVQQTRRLAVLIDAESTTAEWAGALFAELADRGQVSVCRAYADWTSPAARDWWSAPLRHHGIQPHHHFGHDHDQRSLVALTIDAVDLARDADVDMVAIVGDLTSMHPLVVRLNAAGVQVLAFGTTDTPDDVRAQCHEFVDLTSLTDPGRGRHRA